MVAAKKLDVKIGDVVEIAGRRHDVVSDKLSAVALEPVITGTVADLHAERGCSPLSGQEFEDLFGALPSDHEG